MPLKRTYITEAGWLETAVRGIRFRPDRDAVRSELREHFEDKMADLMRIFPDLTPEEAEGMAAAGMGDPEEIGRELAKLHKPWLGYLWRISQGVLAVLLLLTALCFGLWLERELPLGGGGYYEYLTGCYLSGEDPFTEENPLYDKLAGTAGFEDIRRTPLSVWDCPEKTRTEHYLFSLGRAALWQFEEDGRASRQLFLELKVTGLPWEPVSIAGVHRITASDDAGNRYTFLQGDALLEEPCVIVSNQLRDGLLTHTFVLEIAGIPETAREIRLELERGGEGWPLTVPLEEVAG